MDKKELNNIIAETLPKRSLRSSDIPSLDLYLDQILTLVSDATESEVRSGALTKTMINNYSKDGLIKPVKGKKYSKEHIVQMMTIYYLKGILSISDIKRIIDGIYSDNDFNGDKLIASYDRFLSIREKEGELCGNILSFLTGDMGLDPEKNEDLFIILMSMVSVCDALKNAALEIIDKKYPLEEKPQSKEKTKEKKTKKESSENYEASDKKAEKAKAKKKDENNKDLPENSEND